MARTVYSEEFFKGRSSGSLASARQIVPYLKKLTDCNSVIDVGCGLGTWLSVFNECGVADFQGIDGAYVNREHLLIPRNTFIAADLTNPPKVDRKFDLAICLEVAEHLPSTAEGNLIDFLTGLSPVVAFSASIPFQDGTAHINERWLEHWVQHFESRGFVAIDCVRPQFWNNSEVEWWYAQNTLLYAKAGMLENYPRLAALNDGKKLFSWVHPRLLLHKHNQLTNMPMFRAWALAVHRTWKAVRRRIHKPPAAPL